MTIFSETINFLQSTKDDCVLQIDLINEISKRTNKTKQSIRGTLIEGSKLLKIPEIKNSWTIGKNPSRFIRIGSSIESEAYTTTYDTKEKQNARIRILKFIPKKKPLNIITLAGSDGLCVQEIFKKHKIATITNIEQNSDVLNQWVSKGIETKNHNCKLIDFFKSKEFKDNVYDFANLDLMGYASKISHIQFQILNEINNCKYIAITLQNNRKIRNYGEFAEWARKKYDLYINQTLVWITEVFSNYNIIDSFTYHRDKNVKGVSMRVFIFQSK